MLCINIYERIHTLKANLIHGFCYYSKRPVKPELDDSSHTWVEDDFLQFKA